MKTAETIQLLILMNAVMSKPENSGYDFLQRGEDSIMDDWNGSGFKDEGVDHYTIPVGIASVFLSVGSIYILVSQIIYAVLKRKDRRGYRAAFNGLCAAASAVAVVRVGLPHFKKEMHCNELHDIETLAYFTTYLLLWTILWLRQYFFYQSPVLKHLYSTFVHIISVAIEVLVVLSYLASVIEYFVTRKTDPNGCVIDIFEINVYAWISIFLIFLLFQCILLCLLVYPLYKHKRSSKRVVNPVSKKKDKLNRVLFRTAVTSVACIVLDIASVPLRFIFDDQSSLLFYFIYNLNLLVQLIAVIASFQSWQTRLCPWRFCCATSRRSRNSSWSTTVSRSVIENKRCNIAADNEVEFNDISTNKSTDIPMASSSEV